MPVNPDHAIQSPAAVLLERTFALADEAATLAFGERFAQAIESVREAAQPRRRSGERRSTGCRYNSSATSARARPRSCARPCAASAIAGRVRSPTYTLVEPYVLERPAGELALYHFDLYRFTDPAEWADAGFREYFDSGAICLVEWPQRAGRLLGVPDLVFSLDLDSEGDGRVLVARAYSESGKACLERC